PEDMSPVRARLLARAPALPAPLSDDPRWRWLVAAAAAGTLDLSDASAEEPATLAAVDPATLTAAAHAQVIARYHEVDALLAESGFTAAQRERAPAMDRSAAIDRVLTHRVFGLAIFGVVMAAIFTAIFSWAEPVMGLIE